MSRCAVTVGTDARAAWVAALGGLLLCLSSPAALAKNRPPTFLRSCTIVPPEPAPLFAATRTEAPTEDDDDEDGPADDAQDNPRGFVAPDTTSCIAVSGTVNAGFQRNDYRANALTRATGQVPQSETSFPLSATFRIESAQPLADGRRLASAFEFMFEPNGEGGTDVTINEATVTFGSFVFGMAGSRFDFWSGDDFAFIGRIPSRTVTLVAYERRIVPDLDLSLSAEDGSAAARSALPSGGMRGPDGVVRMLYQGDALTLHAAAAVREVPRLGGSSLIGRAAILGASWETKLLGRPLTLTSQIAGAINAGPYIGSRLDQRTAIPLIGGDATTRGWSAVVAAGWAWNDTWSTNAYVSRYRLSLPQLAGLTGKIKIDRVATNLVWAPVAGLRLGVEASLAEQRIDLSGRTLALGFSGRQSSAQLFLERRF